MKFLNAFVIESMTQLLEILCDFGAAEVDWGAKRWRSDGAVAMMLVGNVPLTLPRYQARLTALGRYGIRAILAGEGHIARVAGDLASEDAATLLGVLPYDAAMPSAPRSPDGWPAVTRRARYPRYSGPHPAPTCNAPSSGSPRSAS